MGFCSGTLAAVLDPATAAWVNAVTIAGGTVSAARFSPVDNLIRGLKADGLWTLLDRLWLLAAENQPSALIDIVALKQAAIAGTLSFTVDRGYLGLDGVNQNYIDTRFSPKRDGIQFTQNSAHISAWSNTNTTPSATGGCIMGSTFETPQTNIFPVGAGDNSSDFRCNNSTLPTGTANTNSQGHFLANRISSTQCHGYINGAFTSNQDNASAALGNDTFFICAGNNSNNSQPINAAWGVAMQISMASIGAEFSDAQVTSFYNRLRTYMTAVGVP